MTVSSEGAGKGSSAALSVPVGVPGATGRAEGVEPRRPRTAPTRESVLAYLAESDTTIEEAIDYALSYADAYEVPRWDQDRIVIEHGWLAGRCGRCGEELPDVARPSFSNPVPLTVALLAEHGGTLPDGSYVMQTLDGVAYPVLDGWVMDPYGRRRLSESLSWIRFVVHLPESTS